MEETLGFGVTSNMEPQNAVDFLTVKLPNIHQTAANNAAPGITSFQTQMVPSVQTTPGMPSPIVQADGGGKRYSKGKPRYDLIPAEFIQALAVHYMEGVKKYDDRNWERGMDWGECYRALQSHANKWMTGETWDEDPSMPGYKAHHMIAVAWNAIALYIYQMRGIGNDNRHIVPFKDDVE
jgi:hypothetical protein